MTRKPPFAASLPGWQPITCAAEFTPAAIRRRRHELGMNAAEFWSAIGIYGPQGFHYENGTSQLNPLIQSLLFMQYILGIELRWMERFTVDGDKITAIRTDLGMTEKEFGEALGMSRSAIQNYGWKGTRIPEYVKVAALILEQGKPWRCETPEQVEQVKQAWRKK